MKIQPKAIAAVIMAVIVILEWRKGYFKGLKTYRPSLTSPPYPAFFLSLPVLMAILLPLDPFLLEGIQSFGVHYPKVVDFGGFIGKNVNFWYILGGAYLVSLVIKKEWSEKIFSALLASALTGLVVHFLKMVFLRARPDAGFGPFSLLNWDGLWKGTRAFQSFPSGDVALVAGAAAYFFYESKNRFFRWLIFLFPLSNALSRVSGSRHWFSDTAFSMGIALVLARMIWDYRKHVLNFSSHENS